MGPSTPIPVPPPLLCSPTGHGRENSAPVPGNEVRAPDVSGALTPGRVGMGRWDGAEWAPHSLTPVLIRCCCPGWLLAPVGGDRHYE